MRKSYETSVVPLLLQARNILETETPCSRVANSVFLMGHGEGGYASVAVAENCMVWESISFAWMLEELPSLSRRRPLLLLLSLSQKTSPDTARFYLSYLGFSFSSSRDDMPNYEQGQDMLTSASRQDMLAFLSSENQTVNENDGIEAANSLVPVDDKLSIYDSDFYRLYPDCNCRK